jgi:small subunit ribosomal protein S3
MGQKVNPVGFRLGITSSWASRWFDDKSFAKNIGEDKLIRDYAVKALSSAGISKVEIERAAAQMRINIHSAKPGLVIGRKGKDIEILKNSIRSLIKRDVNINIIEVRKPDIDSVLLAQYIASQLERRVNFRRVVKDTISKAMRPGGCEGIKVSVSGRLNGAEIARTESAKEGRIPLHTLRAEIDYGTARALTQYGIIGIKVWVFKGERFVQPSSNPVSSVTAV